MTQAQFRIGGVYRCRDGQVVRLSYMEDWHDRDSAAQAVAVHGSFDRGARQLSNGTYPYTSNENYGGNLLPGELTLRDGQWVSVEEAKEVQPDADGFIFYDHGWNARALGKPYNPKASNDWKDGWLDCDNAPEADRAVLVMGAATHSANAAMIARDEKPWRAVGQVVRCRIPLAWVAASDVAQSTAKPALAALTRSPDLKATSHLIEPAHGSAFLKG